MGELEHFCATDANWRETRDHSQGPEVSAMRRMIQSIDDYDVGQLLGRGGFASVYRARERSTCLLFAVKIMIKSYIEKHKMESRVFNEIQIHSELNCEGIVKLHSHFEDSEFVYLVLELCEGGNLYQYLKCNGPLSEIEASSVISQLLTSLEYMHAQGVVHRDLKLSNILLVHDSNQTSSTTHSLLGRGIKLCDFGLAIQVGHPDEVNLILHAQQLDCISVRTLSPGMCGIPRNGEILYGIMHFPSYHQSGTFYTLWYSKLHST
jgi:serine/threonine protein kinase